MIRLPRRSVTRFFIPMIDVLTLLFCMFLLLPIFRENEAISQQEEAGGKDKGSDPEHEVQRREQELQRLDSERKRLEALVAGLDKKRLDFLEKNVYVRVLTINPRDGSLWYFDPAEPAKAPVQIATEADARQLIARHRKEAGPLLLQYQFDRPYDPTVSFTIQPTQELHNRYAAWFRDVACTGFVTHQAPDKGGVP
jgi:hypothetical protein